MLDRVVGHGPDDARMPGLPICCGIALSPSGNGQSEAEMISDRNGVQVEQGAPKGLATVKPAVSYATAWD